MTFALLTLLASLLSFTLGYHAGWRDRKTRELEISHAIVDAALEALHDQAKVGDR